MKRKRWGKGINLMRLDKFLKVSRLIKRRTLAKEVSDQGRIQINGNVAKASSNVKEGDLIRIQFGQKIMIVKVKQLLESSKKENAVEMYEIISEERIPESF